MKHPAFYLMPKCLLVLQVGKLLPGVTLENIDDDVPFNFSQMLKVFHLDAIVTRALNQECFGLVNVAENCNTQAYRFRTIDCDEQPQD